MQLGALVSLKLCRLPKRSSERQPTRQRCDVWFPFFACVVFTKTASCGRRLTLRTLPESWDGEDTDDFRGDFDTDHRRHGPGEMSHHTAPPGGILTRRRCPRWHERWWDSLCGADCRRSCAADLRSAVIKESWSRVSCSWSRKSRSSPTHDRSTSRSVSLSTASMSWRLRRTRWTRSHPQSTSLSDSVLVCQCHRVSKKSSSFWPQKRRQERIEQQVCRHASVTDPAFASGAQTTTNQPAACWRACAEKHLWDNPASGLSSAVRNESKSRYVDMPVPQIQLVPQEPRQQRIEQTLVDVPVPRNIVQMGDMPVPQIQLVPQKPRQQRIEQQLVGVPVPRSIVEAIQLVASAAQPGTNQRADGRNASALTVHPSTRREADCFILGAADRGSFCPRAHLGATRRHDVAENEEGDAKRWTQVAAWTMAVMTSIPDFLKTSDVMIVFFSSHGASENLVGVALTVEVTRCGKQCFAARAAGRRRVTCRLRRRLEGTGLQLLHPKLGRNWHSSMPPRTSQRLVLTERNMEVVHNTSSWVNDEVEDASCL